MDNLLQEIITEDQVSLMTFISFFLKDQIDEISLKEDRLSQCCPNLCPMDHRQDQWSKYVSVSSPGIKSARIV
jgi:hypothetical protein